MAQPRYKNVFAAWERTPWYTGLPLDASPGAVSRLRASRSFIAVPLTTPGTIGVLPVLPNGHVGQQLKASGHFPGTTLQQQRPVGDFCWSPHESGILASSSRADGIVRVWNVEYEEYRAVAHGAKPRQLDAANAYLAGHEKRVQVLAWHPLVNHVLASASADGTLRLWNVQCMAEETCLGAPQGPDGPFVSLAWDTAGDYMVGATSDGLLCVLDPRAGPRASLVVSPTLAIPQAISPISPSGQPTSAPLQLRKGAAQVLWGPLATCNVAANSGRIITSGIAADGSAARELHVWDVRQLVAPLQRVAIPGQGHGALELVGDPGLPLMYAHGRSDPVRVLEMAPGGTVTLVQTLESFTGGGSGAVRPSLAAAPLGKPDLLVAHCEIARFVHVLADGSVTASTVRVPRSHGESEFQMDLYPPIAVPNTAIAADEWFSHKDLSVVPLLERFNVAAIGQAAQSAPPPSVPVAPAVNQAPLVTPPVVLAAGAVTRGGTVRKMGHTRRPSERRDEATLRTSEHAAVQMAHCCTAAEVPSAFAVDSPEFCPCRLDLRPVHLLVSLTNGNPPVTSIPLDAVSELRLLAAAANDQSRLLQVIVGELPGANNRDAAAAAVYTILFASAAAAARWEQTLRSCIDALCESTAEAPASLQTALGTSDAALDVLIRTGSVRQKTHLPSKPSLDESSQDVDVGSDKVSRTKSLVRATTFRSSNTLSRINSRQSRARAAFRQGALFVSPAKIVQGNGAAEPVPAWLLLGADGLLHVCRSTSKTFPQDATPDESLDLAGLQCLGPVDPTLETLSENPQRALDNPAHAFYLQFPSVRRVFSTDHAEQAATWLVQIFRLVTEQSIQPAAALLQAPCAEGYCSVVDSATSPIAKTQWVVLANGRLMYFQRCQSAAPELVVPQEAVDEIQFSIESNAFVVTWHDGTVRHVRTHTAPSALQLAHWKDQLAASRASGCGLFDALHLGTVAVDPEDPIRPVDPSLSNRIVQEMSSDPILIAVTGKSASVTAAYKPVVVGSLAPEGVYLLDLGTRLVQYDGPGSSRVSRAFALGLAGMLRKTRPRKPELLRVSDSLEGAREFAVHVLGGAPTAKESDGSDTKQHDLVISALDHAALEHAENAEAGDAVVSLYMLDPDQTLPRCRARCVHHGSQTPSRTLLKSGSVYILHAGTHVYMWTGTHAPESARALGRLVALTLAEKVARDLPRALVRLINVHEGAEDVVFKSKFGDYEGMLPISMRINSEAKGNVAASVPQQVISVRDLLDATEPPSPLFPICGALPTEGHLSVYIVRQFELVPLVQRAQTPLASTVVFRESSDGAPPLPARLSSSDSYVLLFEYGTAAGSQCVAYYWQGASSTQLQQGTAAMLTVELGKSQVNVANCRHVRVTEGKEPGHLVALFPAISGLAVSTKDLTVAAPGRVWDVRVVNDGVGPGGLRAIQVHPDDTAFHPASALVFVPAEPGNATKLWLGPNAPESLASKADSIARSLSQAGGAAQPRVQQLDSAFAATMGDQVAKRVTENAKSIQFAPKLFTVSSLSGSVTVTRVAAGWNHVDLDNQSVMVLDCLSHIVLWIGTTSRINEKVTAMQTFQEYARQSPAHVQAGCKIWVVDSGAEPRLFWREFHGWRNVGGRTSAQRPVEEVLAEFSQKGHFPLDVLCGFRRDGARVPVWVDLLRLEDYLTDESFSQVFKMSRAAFQQLGVWKRNDLKRAAGLF